jgi:hypothetical protein
MLISLFLKYLLKLFSTKCNGSVAVTTITNNKRKTMAAKDKILDYLKSAEGDKLHYNSSEKDVTSHLGIYRYAFPKASVWSLYEDLERILGVSMYTKEGRAAINRYINNNTTIKENLYNLIWDFYTKEFMDEETTKYLGSKSALTFFSLAVNGGKGRAAKLLQKAINDTYEEFQIPKKVSVDGVIGMGTRGALKSLVDNGYYDDVTFNEYMLNYMASFYMYLIHKNPSKYKRYKNGWRNRLLALTDNGTSIKEIMA